jgi:hypothetical protein
MIAFDATASTSVSANSATYAHTCSGSNRILFVGIGAETGTGDSITGVTYAGVSMTQLDTLANTNTSLNYRVYLYMLVDPASGANNVIVSADEVINIRTISVSYNGVLQTGQPDAKSEVTSNTTDQSSTLTVVANNSWIVSCAHGFGVTPTAGSGLTTRGNVLNFRMGDSNGPLAAGSQTVHWTNGIAMDVAVETASFSPAPDVSSGSPAFLFNFV